MTREQTASRLPSGWTLWRLAWSDLRERVWLYFGVVAAVEVPVNLINLVNRSNSSVTAYTSLASVFMNVALIGTIFAVHADPKGRFKLRQLYYDSSRSLLRFLLVGLALALLLIPIALGLGVVSLGTLATTGPTAVPAGELALLVVVGLIISSPSLYFVPRFVLALLVVSEEDTWPWAALGRSWALTRGRFWPIFGRFILLGLALLAVLILPALLLVGLYVATKAVFFLALFQIVINLLILPLTYLYAYRLYTNLS